MMANNHNSGAVVCVGGPAITLWLTPTDEELFKKYNPELQKRSLERRYERQKEFDDFVVKLKEYSKSDKPSKHLRQITCGISTDLILQYGWSRSWKNRSRPEMQRRQRSEQQGSRLSRQTAP